MDIQERDRRPVINISLDTLNRKKQALVFVSTKKSAEKTAEDISKKLKDVPKAHELSEKILNALSKPTKQCIRLAKCVKKGVAFHHAGLNYKQKELIEDAFRQGTIGIIACTPTLAAGLDMPAFRTILKDLKRFGGRWGYDWIPVLEYEQMSGRAGRPGKEEFGESICIARDQVDKDNIFDRFILGKPENIISKLAVEPVLRMYILSLIASDFVKTKQEILDFFSETFWAKQFKDMPALENKIMMTLDLIEEYGFINSSGKADFVSADVISEERYKATRLGKRVAELYLDPLTANHLVECLKKKSSDTYSLIHMISITLEMRPLLRVKKAEIDYIERTLEKYKGRFLVDVPDMFDDEYEWFLDSVKTSLFILDWANERDEDFILNNYSIRPGEIAAKLDIADWLLYTAEEFSRILKIPRKELARLRMRLKYGAKEELLALLRMKNIGRVRARTLYNNGIRDVGDVKKAEYREMASLIGPKIAEDLKKQVGQKVKPVKIKKKGQISLLDY